MNKIIMVQWINKINTVYNSEMRVILSTHERFVVGSRFDYGFFNIATQEGYTIISIPAEEIK